MSILARMPRVLLEAIDSYGFVDDFLWYISPHLWTSTLTDSGTCSITTGAGGIVALVPSDGTVADNDEAYMATTNAVFKPQQSKPCFHEFLVQFTEANTDDANIAVGLASSVAANLIVDDGAGMRTSGTVLAIYKVDGETVWRCVSRNGSSYTVSQSTTTAGGSAYQRLSIEVVDVIGQVATIAFLVDGQYLKDSTYPTQIIKHTLDLTSLAAAQAFAGVKNGSANLETLNVDYVGWAAAR